MSAEIEPSQVITRERAEETAEAIRRGLGDLEELAERAWAEEHWRTLGYESWAAYAAGEFGAGRAVARRTVAALLSGEGLSVRQISEATGVPRSTVSDDLKTGVSEPPDTKPDQGGRNASVTRPKAPKTGSQRVSEHRARKREQEEAAAAAAGQVSGSVTGAEESVSTTAGGSTGQQEIPKQETPKPCAHDYRMACLKCGDRVRPGHELAVFDELRDQMAKLEADRDQWRKMALDLSKSADSAAEPDPGVHPRPPRQGQDYALGNGQVPPELDADGNPIGDAEDFGFSEDDFAAELMSQVPPPRGGRGRR